MQKSPPGLLLLIRETQEVNSCLNFSFFLLFSLFFLLAPFPQIAQPGLHYSSGHTLECLCSLERSYHHSPCSIFFTFFASWFFCSDMIDIFSINSTSMYSRQENPCQIADPRQIPHRISHSLITTINSYYKLNLAGCFIKKTIIVCFSNSSTTFFSLFFLLLNPKRLFFNIKFSHGKLLA